MLRIKPCRREEAVEHLWRAKGQRDDGLYPSSTAGYDSRR